MIVQYIDYVIKTLFPAFIGRLGALMVADGVSLLGFVVACLLITIVIGAIILRAGR